MCSAWPLLRSNGRPIASVRRAIWWPICCASEHTLKWRWFWVGTGAADWKPATSPLAQLYAACRSTANPGLTSLTGAQLAQFVQAGLDPEGIGRTPKALRGTPVGWPHVSGMSVRIKPGESIEFWIGGELLQLDRTYQVVGTDLEFSEIIGYLRVPDELSHLRSADDRAGDLRGLPRAAFADRAV